MFGWHVPAPNQAMLISGGRQKGSNPLPVKIVTGHGSFVMPIRSRVSFLTLAMQEALVTEECVTQQGITLLVRAVIAFKVGDDPESICQRRPPIPGRSGPDVDADRADLLRPPALDRRLDDGRGHHPRAPDAGRAGARRRPRREMAKIGLAVDSLQIQSIDDKGSGYIEALAAPHQATVNQAAQIAQARADQAAAEARQQSLRQAGGVRARRPPSPGRSTSREIDQAQARPGRRARSPPRRPSRTCSSSRPRSPPRTPSYARRSWWRRSSSRLQAEAERIRTLAKAEADRTRMSAEAASAEGRIALDQAIISQLPQMIAAAADGPVQRQCHGA